MSPLDFHESKRNNLLVYSSVYIETEPQLSASIFSVTLSIVWAFWFKAFFFLEQSTFQRCHSCMWTIIHSCSSTRYESLAIDLHRYWNETVGTLPPLPPSYPSFTFAICKIGTWLKDYGQELTTYDLELMFMAQSLWPWSKSLLADDLELMACSLWLRAYCLKLTA